MREYINSILPRIKQFSDSLDKISILIEHPWVIIDDKGNFEKLIFKKNQELIMSLNGIVSIGRWEYLSSAKSLLIDRNTNKILLNQEFVEKGLLILKYDGFSNEYFLLANENLIPDLNIELYLRRIYYNRYNISIIESTDGQIYEMINTNAIRDFGSVGQKVQRNAKDIIEGSFQSKSTNVNYYIKDSRIIKKSVFLNIQTINGPKLIVESFFIDSSDEKPKKGDIVRLNNNRFAPDGIYRLSRFKKINVKNGMIV